MPQVSLLIRQLPCSDNFELLKELHILYGRHQLRTRLELVEDRRLDLCNQQQHSRSEELDARPLDFLLDPLHFV